MSRLATLFAAAGLALGGCHHEPKPVAAGEHEAPPLPPASGTAIGYLLDNRTHLALTDDQVTKLQAIDTSLSARNEGIETQLREIEKPEPDAPADPKAPPERKNMAPGAQPMKSNDGAVKLHEMHDANVKDALTRAFAELDAKQKTEARKLLDARGIQSPQ